MNVAPTLDGMRTLRYVDLVLFGVAITWGSTYLATKALVPTPDYACVVLAARMLVSVLAMLALSRRLPGRAELAAGTATGAILAAIFAAETFGVALTTATNAGVLISLNMVLTPLVGAAIERRRPSAAFLALVVLAIVGDLLLATDGKALQLHLGDGLILLAALLRTTHVTLLGATQRRRALDVRALTTVQLGVVAIVFCVASTATGVPVGAFVAGLGAGDLAVLAYLALACTVFAFFAQTWAIRHTSPARVALLLGTEPVWAAVIGVGIAHEHLGPIGGLGVVLTLAATFAARHVDRRTASPSPDTSAAVPEAAG